MLYKKKIIKIDYFNYLILGAFLSYILGFFLYEDSGGGGFNDFIYHAWPLIKSFKEDFLFTLVNFKSFTNATFPFYHIVISFIPSFIIKNFFFLRFFNFILNIFIVILFYFFLKKKFSNVNKKILMLLSSALFLSPYFRTGTFWVMPETFTFFFLIPACYYLHVIFYNNKKNILVNNIFLAIFSSLTLYSRQQYIFLPLIHFVFLLFYNKNIKIIGLIGLLYLLFSLPGFYTLHLWGTFSDYSSVHALNYVSYKYILKNLFIILSIIFFYSLPLLFINYQYFKKELTNKLFVYRLVILFFVLFFIIFNIEYSSLGGGVFLKFTQFFLNKNYTLLAFLSSFVILLLFNLLKKKEILIFVFIIFFIFNLAITEIIFQEWFDPFYFVSFFLLYKKNFIKKIITESNLALNVFYIFQITFLFLCIYFYHYIKVPFFKSHNYLLYLN
jgi:hypothetical protein